MLNNLPIKAPFFEIGPKAYLFGDDLISLAEAADEASAKYDVDVIFTTPYLSISQVKAATTRIHVYAPHMDSINPGRGLTAILPEAVKAAGAEGVMLNHCEHPLTLGVLAATIRRAEEAGLATIACGDSLLEASALAVLGPDIIVAEPAELIGTGVSVGPEYVQAATDAVKRINPSILVLTAAGIANGDDVYNTVYAGADATGTSSGIAKLSTREARAAMVDEMISAVRRAWDDRHNN